MAIGLTLLICGGRFACYEWMRGEERGDAAPNSGSVQGAAAESAALAAPALVEVGELPPLGASRVLDLESAPAPAASTAASPEWRVRVEVVDAAGPIAGVTVDLSLDRGGRLTPLAVVTTNADGGVDHEVMASVVESVPAVARATVAVVATAHAPRHRLQTLSGTFDAATGACTLRFELVVGAAVRGRVVDSAGAPVEMAMVRGLIAPELRCLGEAWSNRHGAFELPIQSAQ
ncbi:MAG: hypothetical protein EXR73_00885 [Myxococcales bacterium]|nr:hypothetical protein [Myxococcales bacterium]